ncbi:hypothetical protein [Maricaulis maris]|uniref:Lipoprotein n=1 Tax=Maricaulis maris TaxID=74318 RepID=A0A495DM11_9PROT|nr:hypothetical protein [Maricaulis maris]RKR02978.1 hypothetical protein C7435_0923 [Maricaulis maris]
MKRVLALASTTAVLGLSACATETVPMCRAPMTYEMAAFSAIISHNETAVADAMAPGLLQNAFISRDPMVRSHVWGSDGNTRGTVTGMLSQPPLCIFDDPGFVATETSRQVLVYPQRAHDRVAPPVETALADAPLPWGTYRGDYMTCRFEQTATGWKLADLCGYRMPGAPSVTG